jgi:hypothetical protein
MLANAHAGVALIGHVNVPKMDDESVQKLFTGRLIDVGGVSVVPVNVQSSNSIRSRFLKIYLNQDEEKYTAYWTVRRYIGKGNPPRELAGSNEVIGFVQATPGAIGYVDEADLRPGLNVLARK